jgi:hypothetical protein
MQRFWINIIAFLILVWGLVGVVMWLTEDRIYTPEKTLVLLQEAPWLENESLEPVKRREHLEEVITAMIKLDFKQRASLRESGEEAFETFIKSLSDEEKSLYFGRVVEEHFQAVMKGIEKLPAEDRRRIAGTIHRDMKKRADKNPDVQVFLDQDAASFEKNFVQDMTMFFKAAPLQAKIGMAPMFEAFHARMQGFRMP